MSIDTLVDAEPDSQGHAVRLRWASGRRDRVPAIWLRDNCRCSLCQDAGSGQRLIDITQVPPHPAIEQCRVDASGITLWFGPDRHQTRFESAWLQRLAADETMRPMDDRWDAGLDPALRTDTYPALKQDSKRLKRWLGWVRDSGFACLTQVPAEDGALLELVALFGHVRETNYGRFFDVKAVADPINLAYTGLGLPVHTDNPYRDPVPGLQILHCLHSDTEGGDSVLCDGFAVADWLRTEHPDAFELLIRTPVPFRFRDANSDLRHRAPLIELDAEGRLSTVRYNNRSVDTAGMAMDDLGRFYDAYRLFATALQDPRWQIQFKMGSGDLFMVDNRRVLHGRTAYQGPGTRHLQGGYADLDGLYSRLRILEQSGQP